MVRTFLTALLVTATLTASAQRPDYVPVDNDQMVANATKHMQMVDKTVTLTAEQKPQVQAVYMQVERQVQSLAYRMQGQPKEDVEADMKSQYQVMDEYVDRELTKVLTADQLARWREASR